jgi:hypothetical protein
MKKQIDGRKHKRVFTNAQKIAIVEKILKDPDIVLSDVKDNNGEPIPYSSLYNWINMYKAGELTPTAKRNNQWRSKITPSARPSDKQMLEVFTFMNEILKKMIQLEAELSELKSITVGSEPESPASLDVLTKKFHNMVNKAAPKKR